MGIFKEGSIKWKAGNIEMELGFGKGTVTNEMACNEAEVGLTPTTLTRPKDPTIQRS